MTKSYLINTMGDVLDIPAARREAFYAEFPTLILVLEAIVATGVMYHGIRWVDDGETNVTVDVAGIKIPVKTPV